MESALVLFEKLGIYTIPAFLLLAEIILGIYLVSRIRQNRKVMNNVVGDKGDVLAKITADYDDRGYVLVRCGDFMPLIANKNFESITGISYNRVLDDVENLFNVCDYDNRRIIKDKYLKWNGEEELEFKFQNPINEKWLKLNIIKDIKSDYALFVFSDITQDINIYDELKNKLEVAEENSRSKTEFLSKMSHDIRTPMNGISGMLALLKLNLREDKHLEQYIGKAESLTTFLLNLINDILDISRIEAGKIELASEPFNLYSMAEKFDNMFRRTIEDKGLKFDIELIEIENPVVVGDELRISQVLINFISNAIKFTEKGGIQIKFRQVNANNGMADYLFRVRDTGKGIEQSFINDMFKPFEQEDVKIAKKYGGSGLGMAIADQLVHLMNGEIVVDSMVGKGSDFTVYLSLPVAEDIDLATDNGSSMAEEFSWEGVKILMAEDNEINAEIMVEMLEMEGAQIDVASDGVKVVDVFKEKGKGYYDVILMDIQMPVRNGWDAASIIRQMEDIGGDIIPIFALSADAFVEERRHSLELGMNGHLSKPVDYDKLKESVGKVLKG